MAGAVMMQAEAGGERVVEVEGAFIAIGHEASSEIVRGQVDTDENGYVLTEGKSTLTDVAGVFAAGDLLDHTYRQAVTAAGPGCQAALHAPGGLRGLPPAARAPPMKPDAIQATAGKGAAQTRAAP